ncbi:MAG: S8/S53 family peptidase [Bacteroidia bacterium]
MKTIILRWSLSLTLLICGWASGRAQTVNPNYLDGELYLKVWDSSSVVLAPYNNGIPALNLILATFGVDSIYRSFSHPALQDVYRMHFTNLAGTANLISQLQLLPFIEYAEQVPLIRPIGNAGLTPNDLISQQWHLVKIHAEDAWAIGTGSPTVTVAVVDNAFRTTHEDLAPAIFTNAGEVAGNFLDDDLNGFTDDVHGYDVADRDGDPSPPIVTTGWDHGTHCAGIAGAATDNGIGIASIGFGIKIIPVKATQSLSGGNSLTHAYEGVDYAMRVNADVISMSWGSLGPGLTGNLVLSLASNGGAVLVAAAGNNNDSVPFYPAYNDICLAVGSTDQADLRSGFSNYGSYVDVMAPGTDIYSSLAQSDTDYGALSGTSMACPLTAGLAALIKSQAPSLTAQQIRTLIENGCEDIYPLNPGFSGQLGAGRINGLNSLNLITSTTASTTPVNVTLGPNPTSSLLYVRVPDLGEPTVAFRITDALGTIRNQGQLHSAQVNSLDLSGYATGVYFLEIRSANATQVKRIVVSK